MYTTTLDGNFLIEVEIGSGVIHDFLIVLGCAGELSPAPGFLPGVGYIFLHTHRPTIGGQHFSPVRAG
jgi:hypothetical protein